MLRTLLAVLAWRGASEVVERRRALARTGELDLRVTLRRRERIEHALVRAGVREPARALVPVTVPVAVESRTHSSVHVGSVTGADLDDVGLLEAAMRRAATQRALVTPVDDRSDAHRTDWGSMLDDGSPVERARRAVVALGVLPVLAMVSGVALTCFPLVRPLADSAPWFAFGGLALVLAGAIGARWTQPAEDDLVDDEDTDGDDDLGGLVTRM